MNHYDRHVVIATGILGHLAKRIGITTIHHSLTDDVVTNHIGKAVAADKQHIASLDLVSTFLYINIAIFTSSTYAIHDLTGMLLQTENLTERVIGSELSQLSFMKHIQTTVTTVHPEELSAKMSALFDGFEGIDCFFYEGAFSVYEDKGVSGINVPDIDFGWKDGVITPEFRRYIVDRPDALLEKCIIYDGGARRYEIPVHFDEVLEYWEGIRERADRIDVRALVEEKLGYAGPQDFEDWLDVTHLRGLDGLGPLWDGEQALLAQDFDLRALASRRIESIKNLKAQYENN